MRTGLLIKDHPYRIKELDEYKNALIDDLELKYIFRIAASDSEFLYDNFKKVLLDYKNDKETILHRQSILKDFMKNRVQLEKLYDLNINLIYDLRDKFRFGIIDTSPSSVVRSTTDILKYIFENIGYVRDYLDNFSNVESEGLKLFIEDFKKSFNEAKLQKSRLVLDGLNVDNGFMMNASLDNYMREGNYIINRSTYIDKDRYSKKRWKKAEEIKFPVMSESLVNDTNKKLDFCSKEVAKVMGVTTNDIIDFLNTLRIELGFYLSTIYLIRYMEKNNMSYSFPNIVDTPNYVYENLYDLSLSIRKKECAVGNNHNIKNKKIMVITGANQGGKTTYLRSLGEAILLGQNGIIVNSNSMELHVKSGLYTHFDREEDTSLESGKLDDELKRLSKILDDIKENSLVLLNESFQSTNEREGSNIGFEIIKALHDSNIHVISVTHMYELSMAIKNEFEADTCFMRAERNDDGTRTFKISENETLRTSFASDLYKNIFEK